MENSLSDELFCSLKNELREVDAVSYTHLDVYKRQIVFRTRYCQK